MRKKTATPLVNEQERSQMIQDLKVQELEWYKQKRKFKKYRRVRLSRSWVGDIFVVLVLVLFGSFSAYPLVYTISNSLKGLDEIFVFPPRLFPRNVTFRNFVDLFNLIGNTQIPISRYFINTLTITLFGTAGHVLLSSLCAYPLSKHRFPGRHLINQLVVYSLMFSAAVTAIPSYMIISWLGLIDTQLAIIIPAFGFTLGLFLMRQFMNVIPNELLEAAKIDGASEYQIFFRIVMPLVKPAWLTLIILLFQQLWGTDGGSYIFTENLKPLSYALSQIVAGGVARTGTAAAVTVIMLIVPISVFIFNQTKMLETMAHSGLK
ncbi:MAG TPA: carbohydrate ABC transporter permease [Bacilli bacterium]|nr:MAG: Inner membrane ABC transporter permease protein YcjP [Tenericutes bacterium ADurb.BinA124]HNZ50126.1 carbohydrate ABC transporter permease [Bacilli bacterium]HPX83688.1 carbohydrate ABC transporter permease [Bacilli bacterium]HQC74407.1 carbohydrate ABC transporter permease [Bacilli bacterium]